MKRNFFKYIFLFLLLLFSACNITSHLIKHRDNNFTIKDSVIAHTLNYNSIEYKFYATYKDSRQTYSFTGTYINFKDSILYISISPGFGLKVAQILSKPDSSLIYLPLQRSYILDDNKIFIKKYNLAFDFYSLQNFLAGYFFPYPYFNKISEYQADNKTHSIYSSLKNPRNTNITDVYHKCFFNEFYTLDSVSIVDFVLKNELYAKFENFRKYDMTYIQSNIKATYISFDTAYITLKIKNVKINMNPQINFKLPKNAKRIIY